MNNQKLGLGTFGEKNFSNQEQIKLFKKVGFDAFFTEWYPDAPVDQWAECAKKESMIYQSLHAPFNKSDDFWHGDDTLYKIAHHELIGCLQDCARYEIPIMVAHAIIGFDNHNPTDIGIERLGKIIDEAQRLGVKIAFENTEGEEYLFRLFDEFKDNETVGFCWDTGHEICYNRSQDLLEKFGNRLIAVHLNDNLGIRSPEGEITWLDDLHLLPFDGVADWNDIANRLNKCGFDDILTFELNLKSKPDRQENDKYSAMPFEDYLKEAFSRACRVAKLTAK